MCRELCDERDEQRGVALQDHRVRLAVGKPAENRARARAKVVQELRRFAKARPVGQDVDDRFVPRNPAMEQKLMTWVSDK